MTGAPHVAASAAGRTVALLCAAAAAALGATPARAAKRPPMTTTLTAEHVHPSGAFSFRTPEGWSVAPSAANPADLEAAGDGLLLRFAFREGELGYDSLHADCLLEQSLVGRAQANLNVRYEYEYLDGIVAQRRSLDTALTVRYEGAVHGARDWRQRTITVVGGGQSLCVSGYAPLKQWKSSRRTRELLDAVLGSLAFRSGGAGRE